MPGFQIVAVEDQKTLKMLIPIFSDSPIYEVLSHMGCSCGLSAAGFSQTDEQADYQQRVRDVTDFVNYIETHSEENQIAIFSSPWSHFPKSYPQKDFNPSAATIHDFDVEDMVILRVK